MRVWSWNIRRQRSAWRTIIDTDSVDVVLLQEAIPPPRDDLWCVVPSRDDKWVTAGSKRDSRTCIAWRSDRTIATQRPLGCLGDSSKDTLCVSREGTISAVDVMLSDGPLTLISAYGNWETPCSKKVRPGNYADASAHRIISDISALIDAPDRHRIVVAGDFNILNGYGENGSKYWNGRYDSVFSRLASLGLKFIGPQAPEGGRQADPWPAELPPASKNVPTFYSNRQTPATATRQLDFVFASSSIADRTCVRALNAVDNWGASDHCRIAIVVN
jgi:Endonuclease/Exonuclease/phosphatase family